jgi:cyclic pyranopterin phosphate synthase
MSNKYLSHINPQGMAEMVDISGKEKTLRQAVACGTMYLPESIFSLISNNEIHAAKGPVFNTAIVAGTMAVKSTFATIPFCHHISIESCKFSFDFNKQVNEVLITCEILSYGKTGAEMEALHGVSVACLTVYDMCKALSPLMVIKELMLFKKSGGKNDFERA